MGVVTAYEQIGLINEICTIRTRADEEFDRIFSQRVKMAMLAGIGDIAIPRIVRRQTLCTNVPREDRSAKIYWKRAIFVPYLHGLQVGCWPHCCGHIPSSSWAHAPRICSASQSLSARC